jgi:hypothetical protein
MMDLGLLQDGNPGARIVFSVMLLKGFRFVAVTRNEAAWLARKLKPLALSPGMKLNPSSYVWAL